MSVVSAPAAHVPPPSPRVHVLESLGAGGMGEVFKARLTGAAGFQRDVVLKRLHARNVADAEFRTMFADEARLLGFLRHPNVVEALDFYEDDGQRFLVLEYVDGVALSEIFRDGRDVPAAVVAFVGREVCRALDYVHGVRAADGAPLGVVHQDVTPSNIMLTREGTVKLLDFGLARFAQARHVPAAGMVKGKPSYLAPEQLGDAPVDGRADLFALGVVLHELLTGVRLFRGEDDLATLKQLAGKPVVAPSKARAGAPCVLDRVVMRALERDPERRYPSAAAMARDLDEVVVESRLRLDEVAAFARVSRASAPRAAAPAEHIDAEATRLDLRLIPARWIERLPGGRRTALAAAVAVALGVGTVSLGARHRAARRSRLAPTHAAALGSPSSPDIKGGAAAMTPARVPKPRLAAAL